MSMAMITNYASMHPAGLICFPSLAGFYFYLERGEYIGRCNSNVSAELYRIILSYTTKVVYHYMHWWKCHTLVFILLCMRYR